MRKHNIHVIAFVVICLTIISIIWNAKIRHLTHRPRGDIATGSFVLHHHFHDIHGEGLMVGA